MAEKIKVSVLLTSYNHAKYLRESIESVLNQAFKDFELIIWDDASTDESWQIITSYADSRIRIFRNETTKHAEYVIQAISEEAHGEFIAIHHSDDVWEPEKLAKQLAFLEANPQIGAVFSNALIIGENGEPFQSKTHPYSRVFDQPNRSRYSWLNYFFYHGNALCHPSVLIRKECYQDVGLYRYGLAHTDFDMWVRLCLKYEIYVLPEKLVRFRVRSGEMNSSGDRPDTRIRGQFEFLQANYLYREIKSFEELVKIFPAAQKYSIEGDFDLGFALGMIALEPGTLNVTKLFGLQLVFEALNDPERAHKVKKLYNFSHLDFLTLSAKYDIFSVELAANLSIQVQALSALSAQLSVQLEEKKYQLNTIYDSFVWNKIVRPLQRIYTKLIPPGSRRERIYTRIRTSERILRREGFQAFQQKVFTKKLVDSFIKVEPFVTIVIPVFNAVHFTKNCLAQLYRVHNETSFEVIVVDNHSTDTTNVFLAAEKKSHTNFNYYRLPENLGFAGAINYGSSHARGNIIVILNNDTLVTSGWLDRLVEPFAQDQRIGIVSPITNYVGEGPQIDLDAKQINPDAIEGHAQQIKERSFIYESNRLVFFCAAIKREVLDIVGNLDTGYEKGNYEDDDFCMRTIVAGFRLAIARNSFVYHFGSITFKKNKISHNDFMERNRGRFYQKAQNISTTLFLPRQFLKDTRISVVVRTLNRPELLRKALTSLSNQSLAKFEAVVVNDGGEDVTNILRDFEKYFPITSVNNSLSLGRTAALNTGVRHSKGEWISFLDDDDILYPWHLNALFVQAQQNPDFNFFYSDYNWALINSRYDNYPIRTEGAESWEFNRQDLLVQNHLPIHTWLISQKCFDVVGGFTESQAMLEDYEFLIRLSKAFDFWHVRKFTCEYRYYLDGVNSMTTQRNMTLDALRAIYLLHPVDDLTIMEKRALTLRSLGEQTQKIEDILRLIEKNPEQRSEYIKQIVFLVIGI